MRIRRVRSPKLPKFTSSEYYTWVAIKQRCYNQKHEHYESYGGRGITVCQRWLDSFDNFLEDMGNKPEGLTLDRIDNDRGYSPRNCRWTTRSTQGANKRKFRGASSQYHGVNKLTLKTKVIWTAGFKLNNKTISIGRYTTEVEAANAYDSKIIELGLTERPLNKVGGGYA